MGSLGCSYRDRINSWPKVPVRAAVVATLLAIFILNERMDFSLWLWPTVVFLCFGLAVPVMFEWTRNNPLDLWLGHLSYPLYLGHLGVLWWMSKHPDLLRQMFWGHVGVIASLVLAVLLHVLIERPIDTWRQRRLKR
jgi:peptidoglycan/LPS O-acetylase OafA/YrhL